MTAFGTRQNDRTTRSSSDPGPGAARSRMPWPRLGRRLLVERGHHITSEGLHAPVSMSQFDRYGGGVGGDSKFFGAALYRLREQDFAATEHESGISPPWPISYTELEPFYARAEALYRVHGSSESDPTEPPRSSPWPHPPIPHQGPVIDLVARLRARAMVPVSHIPKGIDYGPAGACRLCQACDAYFCPFDAKMDAEAAALRPALRTGNVTLLTGDGMPDHHDLSGRPTRRRRSAEHGGRRNDGDRADCRRVGRRLPHSPLAVAFSHARTRQGAGQPFRSARTVPRCPHTGLAVRIEPWRTGHAVPPEDVRGQHLLLVGTWLDISIGDDPVCRLHR